MPFEAIERRRRRAPPRAPPRPRDEERKGRRPGRQEALTGRCGGGAKIRAPGTRRNHNPTLGGRRSRKVEAPGPPLELGGRKMTIASLANSEGWRRPRRGGSSDSFR